MISSHMRVVNVLGCSTRHPEVAVRLRGTGKFMPKTPACRDINAGKERKSFSGQPIFLTPLDSRQILASEICHRSADFSGETQLSQFPSKGLVLGSGGKEPEGGNSTRRVLGYSVLDDVSGSSHSR